MNKEALNEAAENILQSELEKIGKGNSTQIQFCYDAIFKAMKRYAQWQAEQKQVVTEQEIHAAGLNAAIENGYIDDSYTSAFIKGFKSVLQYSSSGQIKDLLHTILNCQQEVYIDAFRVEMVRVADIKTCFDEYFGIKEEPEF